MKLYRREKYLKQLRGFYDADDLIKVITGVRRCGKSSLLLTIMQELEEKGVSKENIIHFDLDGSKFRHVKTADQLDVLLAPYVSVPGLKYLFIDEVQNVQNFEEVINGYRNDGNFSLFITGSNSYLLSGDLVTKLTGRYLELEVFPLSFDEYEAMKQFYDKAPSEDLLQELNSYILEGGFPRALFLESLADKRSYTRNVVNEIFDKDITQRLKIRDREAFEAVKTFVINNFGATTSMSNLHQALQANGMKVSRATVSRYIQALVDAKIMYECNRFDMKSKRSLSGEKKYYLSDLSFYFSQNTDNRINYGPVLENIVYVYARSMGYAVSVGRIGKLECDFILRSQQMDYSYVQVAYTILASKETEDREYRALEAIRDNYPKYVLTTDVLLQKRNGIKHENLMRFMKNQQLF